MMNSDESMEYNMNMRDGLWYENNAELYEQSGDFLTAKSKYIDAMYAYEMAYDIANRVGDYAANDAYSKMCYCRNQATEMGYRYETEKNNLTYQF